MRANALASLALLAKNSYSFLKHISVDCNKKICTPTKVDDCVGDEEITDIELKHYSSLLNSVNESVNRDELSSYLNDCSNDYASVQILVGDIDKGLRQAKLSKSCGVYGLAAEHLICASNCAKVYLSFYLHLLFHMAIYPIA